MGNAVELRKRSLAFLAVTLCGGIGFPLRKLNLESWKEKRRGKRRKVSCVVRNVNHTVNKNMTVSH